MPRCNGTGGAVQRGYPSSGRTANRQASMAGGRQVVRAYLLNPSPAACTTNQPTGGGGGRGSRRRPAERVSARYTSWWGAARPATPPAEAAVRVYAGGPVPVVGKGERGVLFCRRSAGCAYRNETKNAA